MQSFLQYRRLRPTTQSPSLEEKADPLENRSSEDQRILVDWDGPLDSAHPRNWSLTYKLWVSFLVSINVFALDWCSAADSQAIAVIAAEYDITSRIASVGSAMFVFGIAAGALLTGPITETVGRNPIYVLGRIIHFSFILGTALAKNSATHSSCRFFAGLGASTILAVHGASIADLYGQEGRGIIWPFVALWSFFGTTFPPVVGAWLVQSETISWRWTDWIAVILSGATFIVTFFFMPETYSPTLLSWKAAKLRKLTGFNKYMAPIEMQSSLAERLKANLLRAFMMCTREYIVIFLGLWLVIVYVVVFGLLAGMHFLFAETYGFSLGQVGTVFTAIAVGIALNTALALVYSYDHYQRSAKLKKEKGSFEQLEPEYRMLPAFPLALGLPASLFWLGWSNKPSISPWSGIMAVSLFGFSWAGIYVCVYHYIFDTYSIYAGSALASITFVRYFFAGSIQIISPDMWKKLGTNYTCTLLGCIATALIPVPIILWFYGEKIRKISKYAKDKLDVQKAEGPDSPVQPQNS
ncbi:putative efflux pump [Podosphaera aphanis]|nr:putative efflux pump [Podosphaera aphanis]